MELNNVTSSHLIDTIDQITKSLSHHREEILPQNFENLMKLKERLKKGRFHLAILGQFKRGKSTLLNAILGEKILPTGVVPLTAIPTFIKKGKNYHIKISFQDSGKEKKIEISNSEKMIEVLSQYVTEEKNPRNKLRVNEVEISIPNSPILNEGVVLIDTPGIGSTHKHNTEATLNFLPQCDAALFVLSPDPPITEVEMEFLKNVKGRLKKLILILNKKDYLEEEELEKLISFLIHTIEKNLEEKFEVFSVSAKNGLRGKLEKNGNLIEKSGLKKLEHFLRNKLVAEKNKILENAIREKVLNTLDEILMSLNLKLISLQMPINTLEEKLKIFTDKLKEIEYQKIVTKDILEGDRKRMHKTLEERAQLLSNEAKEYLQALLKEKISEESAGKIEEKDIEEKISKSIPPYFEKKIGEETFYFKKSMKEILSIHQKKANEIIEMVRKNAAEIFEIPYVSIEEEEEFKIVKEPYWISHKWKSTFSPISPGTIDKMLPAKIRKQRILKRMTGKINELVIYNVENIRWSIYQSIDQNFRIFSNTLEEKLNNSIEATKGAIEKSLQMAKNHSEKQKEVMENLKNLKKKVEKFKKELSAK